jgi:hypothetical protein
MIMLTDIEDSLLAMSEGEPVQQKVAVQVLSSWYARRVVREEVILLAVRLAKLGLVRWVYRRHGKLHFSKRARISMIRSSGTATLATAKGREQLNETKRHDD